MSESKLCVMQVLPELVTGGVERGTIDIAQALISAGHQAIVVSNGGPLVKDLETMGALHISLPVHSKNPLVIWRNSYRLQKLVQRYKVDILHARSRAPAWSCFWASQMTSVPFVTTFHGTYGHHNSFKRWYNRVMCRGDLTIAVSEFIAEHISAVYQSSTNKNSASPVRVIHRGIDMSLFHPFSCNANEVEQLKVQWRVPENKKLILLPGRLTRLKGQLSFIDAIASINRDDVYCLIVGSDQGRTHYSDELRQRIQFHGLTEQIKLCGHCDNMTVAYSIADIVVSASNQPEAFGRVACEAQAMECLVVATQHGGAKETIAPTQQAWQCLPNNTESLAKALVLSMQALDSGVEAITRESREYIQQNFALEKMSEQTLDVYRQLAGSKN